jgi:predicted transcriptional regulator
MESKIKDRIIEVLRENPQGLNILDIARIVGMSRFTISKYVYCLTAEKLIMQREVGHAKMCYPIPPMEYVELDDVEKIKKELVYA